MASINQLVFDVMEIVRGQQISDDTDISEKQVIYQINNQRALWLKREQNKPGASIDSQIVQDLGCLELIEVDAAECCTIELGCTVLRTRKQLPKFINFHSGLGITRVGPIHKLKLPFTYTNYDKAIYTANAENKYSKGVLAFLLNGYVYTIMTDPNMVHLTYINVRGVVEDPTALKDYKCDSEGTACFSYDDEYPLNADLIPFIKEQVLAQLGVMTPKDTANDGQEMINKQ
tara:strand:+ start:2858 stop:3550 length:693 start_codon:yes stop_codon:yes gene_type:complete